MVPLGLTSHTEVETSTRKFSNSWAAAGKASRNKGTMRTRFGKHERCHLARLSQRAAIQKPGGAGHHGRACGQLGFKEWDVLDGAGGNHRACDCQESDRQSGNRTQALPCPPCSQE